MDELHPDLRSLLESLSDAALCVDAGGVVRFANAGMEALLGRSPAEVTGQAVSDVLEVRDDQGRRLSLTGSVQEAPSGVVNVTRTDGICVPISWSGARQPTTRTRGKATGAAMSDDEKTLMMHAINLSLQKMRSNEGGPFGAVIVKDGAVITRPLSNTILPGVTRASLLELIKANPGLRLEERPFTLEEAYAADEAFITGASTCIAPVIRIDDRPVGAGAPGPLVQQLQGIYMEKVRAGLI